MSQYDFFDGCLLISPQVDLNQSTLDLPVSPGVCLFSNDENQPILLLYGANLRSLVRRRLGDEANNEKNKRTRLRPVTTRLWFRRTYSPFETHLNYFNIAREVYPQTYRELFPRLETWFVCLNRRAKYPFFTRTSTVKPNEQMQYWGPLPSKKSAELCLETLQNIFNLCRCPHLLEKAPHVNACSYAQMNRCAAVCDGTVSRQEYLELIDQAANLLNQPIMESIANFQEKMDQFSKNLQFEQAQRQKEKIELIKKMQSPAFRWFAPLEKFFILAFLPGAKIKVPKSRSLCPTITPFLVTPNRISQIESLPLDQAQQVASNLLDHLGLAGMQSTHKPLENHQIELLAWIVHLLYKTDQQPRALFLRADENLDELHLTEKIISCFTKKPDNNKQQNGKNLKLDNFNLTDNHEERSNSC
ncbi:MAG: hypothetical protein JXD22_02345 [Sedimentisphaerales bacterium]|nr:hypothetical protein [Sedimentisphaerales bacterium]